MNESTIEQQLARLVGVDVGNYSIREEDAWGTGVVAPDAGLAANMARWGLWWCAPCLSVYGAKCLGRLLDPYQPVLEAPFLLSHAPYSVTAGADIGAAIRFAFLHVTLAHPSMRAHHAARWPIYRDHLAELHSLLGGEGVERLDAAVAELSNSRVKFVDRTEESERLLARILRLLDPDPRFHRYVDWGESIILAHKRGPTRPPDPPPPGLGPWMCAAEALFFRILLARGDTDPTLLATAGWRLMINPPGLDAGPSQPTLFRQAVLDRNLLLAAAEAIATAKDDLTPEIADDPLLPAVIEAAARGHAYDGSAHVTSAGLLDAGGERARAWWAVAHAAFWLAGIAARPVNWGVIASQITLAETSGWHTIAAALRHMHGRTTWTGDEAR